MKYISILENLGLTAQEGNLAAHTPIDGSYLGDVQKDTFEGVEKKIRQSVDAFHVWKTVPAPKRGELVRLFGEVLRENKEALGSLVTLECGKIYQEGLGEVQEMIDICDFAVGLSRQLYGRTIVSERHEHKMREYWQPMGPVGIISAFNFPVAVWAWNAALALVCGDSVIWKPSEKTPLCAIACQTLFDEACTRYGSVPDGLSQILIGESGVGEQLVKDRRVPIISATGSSAMGRKVGPIVAERFGRSILELGGNNAIIVTPSADLDLAHQAIVFGAVGTCGQRCTTTRRLFVHEDIYDQLLAKLKASYEKLVVGDPLDDKTLVGPLIDKQSYDAMEVALDKMKDLGCDIHGGGRKLLDSNNGYYVYPAIVEARNKVKNIKEETFAPILYVFKYSELSEAIDRQNDVPQGLSSSIFTKDVIEAETFTCESGSDCGIANVNIGTSGAEIGGAFGGEKETGGGRESGSDSWKGYMRRMTSTLNYSSELPLAQGISFNTED